MRIAERLRIRFSLTNLLLAVLPLAVLFNGAHGAVRDNNWMSFVIAVELCLPAALGALYAGWPGLWTGGVVGIIGFMLWLYLWMLFHLGAFLMRH